MMNVLQTHSISLHQKCLHSSLEECVPFAASIVHKPQQIPPFGQVCQVNTTVADKDKLMGISL